MIQSDGKIVLHSNQGIVEKVFSAQRHTDCQQMGRLECASRRHARNAQNENDHNEDASQNGGHVNLRVLLVLLANDR